MTRRIKDLRRVGVGNRRLRRAPFALFFLISQRAAPSCPRASVTEVSSSGVVAGPGDSTVKTKTLSWPALVTSTCSPESVCKTSRALGDSGEPSTGVKVSTPLERSSSTVPPCSATTSPLFGLNPTASTGCPWGGVKMKVALAGSAGLKLIN
jgi:hypothetical protein